MNRSICSKTFLCSLFLITHIFIQPIQAQMECSEDPFGGDYADFIEFWGSNFDDIQLIANFIGVNDPELVTTISPGETMDFTISEQNTFINDNRVIENLVFMTGCRDIMMQGSSNDCQQNGGAGSICTTIFECNDFHIWTPPSTSTTPCNDIFFALPSSFGLAATINVTLSYNIPAGNCPIIIDLNQPNIPSGFYQAAQEVRGSNSIAPLANVLITAGQCVTLESGFEAPEGSTVSISIEGCSVANSQSPQVALKEKSSKRNTTIESIHNAFYLYPNPANSQVSVSLDHTLKNPVKLIIQNMSGQVLKTQMMQPEDGQHMLINIVDLPEGIYLVLLATKYFTYANKFIVVSDL